MILDYDMEKSYQQSVEIPDLGNVCLRCFASEILEYYINFTTYMGKTYIMKFGPVTPDVEEAPDFYSFSYLKTDYNEKFLKKELDQFINGKIKMIHVEVIEPEEAYASIPSMDLFSPY